MLRLSTKVAEAPFIPFITLHTVHAHGEKREGYVGLKTDLSLALLAFFILLAFRFWRSEPLPLGTFQFLDTLSSG